MILPSFKPEKARVELSHLNNGEISVFFWRGTGRESPFLGELVQSANLTRMLDVSGHLWGRCPKTADT